MSTICPIREDFEVEISEATEGIYVVSITVAGILTILISLLLILLILRRSPKMTKENRVGLASLQICFLLFSLHNCCLFQLVPALPFFAGYCLGILCKPLRSDFHLLFCLTCYLTVMTFVLFLICIFQRYQTVVLRGSPWKLGNIRFLLFTAVVVVGILPTGFYFNGRLSEEEVEAKMESYPAMAWLRSKPRWTVYSLTANPIIKYLAGGFCFICIMSCVISTVLIVLTVKIFKNVPNQSKKAHLNIQRATTILFIQFGIFILFLLVPVVIIGSQALAVFEHLGPYPFLVAVICFFSHGLFISLTSIIMSKDHRISIAAFLRMNGNLVNVTKKIGSIS